MQLAPFRASVTDEIGTVDSVATSDFVTSVRGVLDDLADAVATERAPAPLPPLAEQASHTGTAPLEDDPRAHAPAHPVEPIVEEASAPNVGG